MEYQKEALFIYDEAGADWVDTVTGNPFGTAIRCVDATTFLESPEQHIGSTRHLVVTACMAVIEPVLQLCLQHQLSIGFLPLPTQKAIQRHFMLPRKTEESLELALRDAAGPIDLISCNDRLMLFKAVTGRIPLLHSYEPKPGLLGLATSIRHSIKSFFTIRLRTMTLKTANEQQIDTALSGIVLQRSSHTGYLSHLKGVDFSMCDGQVGAVLVSPFSVMEYLRVVVSVMSPSKTRGPLPSALGIVKSRSITIESTRRQQALVVDDTHTLPLPATCEVLDKALNINAPEAFWEANPRRENSKESIKVANLPDARESQKYRDHHIPFFSYASEERFKDLFGALREDSKIDSIYITLMLLSTLLATVGLFADSSAVVIGAMLLAPLMSPIVSFSMGLLRADRSMLKSSLNKIFTGIVLALIASALLALVLPNVEMTAQMKARIHPTLLDLAVAIISGIAAAYSKSFKEIIQSLAGVSIAVALVPPLSTAGIGLGQGEWIIFAQASLLFFTNLIGITLAATFTFQALGYSNAVKSKKSILAILLIMLVISYPLYLSMREIVVRQEISRATGYDRFLVGNKYIIVKSATIRHDEGKDILNIRLYVREAMQREELNILKKKIESAFGRELHIDATVEYIL